MVMNFNFSKFICEHGNLIIDISDLSLVYFGLAISLFTLIYSFINSKRDELNNVLLKINMNMSSPEIVQKRHFLNKEIKNYKSTNRHLIIITFLSLSIYLLTFIYKNFLEGCDLKKTAFFLIICIAFFTSIYILTILIIVVKKYYKTHNS